MAGAFLPLACVGARARDHGQGLIARTQAIKKPRRDFLIKLLVQNYTKDKIYQVSVSTRRKSKAEKRDGLGEKKGAAEHHPGEGAGRRRTGVEREGRSERGPHAGERAGSRQWAGTGSLADEVEQCKVPPNLVKGQVREGFSGLNAGLQSLMAQRDKGGPHFKFCTWCWNDTS